jgi:hypothetical protein
MNKIFISELVPDIDIKLIEMSIKANIDNVLDGEKDALKLFLDLKTISEICESAKSQILEIAIKEIPEDVKTYEKFGAKFSRTQSGRYDYSEIPQIQKLEIESKRLQKLSQAAYKLHTEIPDPETGEMIPPANYNPNKISISIKQ